MNGPGTTKEAEQARETATLDYMWKVRQLISSGLSDEEMNQEMEAWIVSHKQPQKLFLFQLFVRWGWMS
jgi:hypothetical protein